jgi:uncharacterized membrane protein
LEESCLGNRFPGGGVVVIFDVVVFVVAAVVDALVARVNKDENVQLARGRTFLI